MQPSGHMQKDKASESGKNPNREPFITIDDLLHTAQELVSGLERLSALKHPLGVRRGVRKGVKQSMSKERRSRQSKAAGRTYFLDIAQMKEEKPYLRITESRKGEGDKWRRASIHVFPEDAEEFATALTDILTELDQEENQELDAG